MWMPASYVIAAPFFEQVKHWFRVLRPPTSEMADLDGRYELQLLVGVKVDCHASFSGVGGIELTGLSTQALQVYRRCAVVVF